MALFGNRIFADGIKKTSYWIRVGLESKNCHPYKRRGHTDRRPCEGPAETDVMQLQDKEGRGFLGAIRSNDILKLPEKVLWPFLFPYNFSGVQSPAVLQLGNGG